MSPSADSSREYLGFAAVLGGPEPQPWFLNHLRVASKLADELGTAPDRAEQFGLVVRYHLDGPLWPLDFTGARRGKLQARERAQVIEVGVPPDLPREARAVRGFLSDTLQQALAIAIEAVPSGSPRSFDVVKGAVDVVAQRLNEASSGSE